MATRKRSNNEDNAGLPLGAALYFDALSVFEVVRQVMIMHDVFIVISKYQNSYKD